MSWPSGVKFQCGKFYSEKLLMVVGQCKEMGFVCVCVWVMSEALWLVITAEVWAFRAQTQRGFGYSGY